MTAERRRVVGQTVVLDGAQLTDSDYEDCNLVYAGGTPPSIHGCSFSGSRFVFENAAENTLVFLRWLAHGDPSGKQLVVRDMIGVAE